MTTTGWHRAAECDRRTLRDMLGSFMTGITVVATRDGEGSTRAFTANSFTSVSLDPPMILVCLAKTSRSYSAFIESDDFSVSILGDWQREQSNAFSSQSAAKESELANMVFDAAPYVRDSLAAMICSREQAIDAGDHVILVGRVNKFANGPGAPLGYFRGGYVSFALGEDHLEHGGSSLMVGGLLRLDEGLLLCRRIGSSYWEIPSAPLISGQQHGILLKSLFARFGLEAQPLSPYSIYQERGDSRTTMVFAMEPTGETSPNPQNGTMLKAFGAEECPWDLVRGEMGSSLIRRFFDERASLN